MTKTWNVLKADSLPSGEQLQELELEGWTVVSVVSADGEFYVYLRRSTGLHIQ